MGVVMYYPVSLALQPTKADSNWPFAYLLLGVAVLLAGVSYPLRIRFSASADGRKIAAQVRTAYIVAYVICEAAAVLGLIVLFASGWPLYWVFFLIGLAGLALQFPRQSEFE